MITLSFKTQLLNLDMLQARLCTNDPSPHSPALCSLLTTTFHHNQSAHPNVDPRGVATSNTRTFTLFLNHHVQSSNGFGFATLNARHQAGPEATPHPTFELGLTTTAPTPKHSTSRHQSTKNTLHRVPQCPQPHVSSARSSRVHNNLYTIRTCSIAHYITGEIPSMKIFESDKTFAFLDIGPLSRGHSVSPTNNSTVVSQSLSSASY
jgi:hypothetical protein